MFGYAGKMLWVDLSKGSMETRKTDQALALTDGGAKGFEPDHSSMLDEYYEARGWD